jgi:hypothetical protein
MRNWRVPIAVAVLLGLSCEAIGQTDKVADGPAGSPLVGTQPSNSANGQPTGKPRVKAPPADPFAAAVKQQSGIDQEQARTLLQSGGYSRVIDLRPQPNSIWVWQADVMKDGRPVRVGIDYRGKLLELSANAAVPCASPGVAARVSGFGVGTRLSEATACAGR